MMDGLERFCVSPHCSLGELMAAIDRNAKGIALVVDQGHHLIGTVTDGDVRRAILDNETLDAPVARLLARKVGTPNAQPVTAPVGTRRDALLSLMRERAIRHVPLLDSERRVVDLITMDELLPEQILPLQAVIVAGGLGTRLRPLTEDLPKPMLPVGDRPLMELMIERLHQAGIQRVNITTHHRAEKITEYFGDGRDFGVEIRYVTEDRPLGTAGALGLMEAPSEPLLVINGDILTRVDLRAMLTYHREHGADLTVGVRQYDLQVPYGVLECEGAQVRRLREKPSLRFLVNAGVYLLEPGVHQYIPRNHRFDMTDLIQALLQDERLVVSFPIVEYWLDIGQHRDYAQAQQDISDRRF